MRYLLPLLLMPAMAFARPQLGVEVNFDAPTTKVGGSPLSSGEISHYEVCVDEVCSEIKGSPASLEYALTINTTSSLKLRTVLSSGLVSDWTDPFLIPSYAPNMPTNVDAKIKVTVTIEVGN